jgi:hypothetical protein
MVNYNRLIIMAVVCLLIIGSDCYAATIYVDCSSSSTVQTALNNAASGDTVQCNATATYTWSTVTLPSSKNITLDGNNSTLAGSGTILSIPNSASYNARVTRFVFHTDSSIHAGSGGFTNKPWRIDHCTFNGSGLSTTRIAQLYGPGLIDHCTWTNIPTAKETTWNGGIGSSGWTDAVTPGNPEGAVYVEDSTMTGASAYSSSLMHNFQASRVVLRHNTLNNIMLDAHGNESNPPSTRWWELYNNTLNGGLFCLRGGSGLVFNNTGSGTIIFVNEAANTSTSNGIGRGQLVGGVNSYVPAYVWNNTPSESYNVDGCSYHNGSVAVGSDVIEANSGTSLPGTCTANPPQGFWKTDTSTMYKCTATNTWTVYYQPLTYPHPLQNNVTTSTVRPNPPSLR